MSFAIPGFCLPNICGTLRPMPQTPADREATREQFARFAAAVKNRRDELDLTQDQVKAKGGPSTPTLSGIESGVGPTPTRSTLLKLDTALGWVRGSARLMLYEGVEPTVAADTAKKSGDSGTGHLQALASVHDLERGPLGRLYEIRRQIDLVIGQLRGE